jgi:hypothetical protein
VSGTFKRGLFLLHFSLNASDRLPRRSCERVSDLGCRFGAERFGIEECSYWTDSAGRAIPWAASRVKQPGDLQHRCTRFRLGPVSISIPLPPIDFAFLAGLILITRSTRRRAQTNDEPVKV